MNGINNAFKLHIHTQNQQSLIDLNVQFYLILMLGLGFRS